jgi:hypothetical protein
MAEREATDRQRIARDLRAVTRALEPRPVKRPPMAPPVILFPMRLEYRVLEAGRPVVHAGVREGGLLRERREGRSRSGADARSAGRAVRHLEFRELTLARREIWMRWLPDDPFTAQGVPPQTAAESAALERFHTALHGAAWSNHSHPEVRAAFTALAQEIGAWRALHLLRMPEGGRAGWEEEVGRLAVLPERVMLFALAAGKLARLGQGAPIPRELRLSPAQLRPGNWLVDFQAAVDQGMGLRLTDPEQVAAALAAEWIVALGLAGGDASAGLETFLADALANGGLEFAPVGTPTNRVANRPPVFEREPSDPGALLARATQRETPEPGATSTDAAHLSAALGLDPYLLDGVPGARERGRESAKAMARALLPGLTDALFRRVREPGVQDGALVDFLCENAFARGPFTPVRFAHTPYGVLPLMRLELTRAPAAVTAAERLAFLFSSQLASASIEWLGAEAASLPIVRPDDPLAHEKMDEALHLNPVSVRTAVRNLPGREALALRCPLVSGPGFAPREYLPQLAERPLDALANPDESDPTAPLLYRLVRFSREVLAAKAPGLDLPVRGNRSRTRGARGVLGARAAVPEDLAAALRALAGVPDGELQRLLLEVLDLVDHRADAWFTALATCRLSALRAAQPRGLRAGWYGFLARLRPQADGASDGFIQAPSLAQAVTAGMLRSAALRHPGGSFDIDLSSRRAGRAVRLLGEVRQGATLGQALGDAAARLLHDRGQDFVLYLLRAAYPLAGDAPPAAARPLDGLALHEDTQLVSLTASPLFTALPDSEKGRSLDRAREARQHTAELLDALSDLVIAEAAHQLTLGNAGGANAWMQVLSGDPPPHELVFLRTPRDAQGSTYRWAVVSEAATATGQHPRSLIEPALAALAAACLPSFDSCRVGVALPGPDGAPVRRSFLLAADLGMAPIDLLVGAESEVLVRARFALVRAWRADAALQAELGPPPPRDVLGVLFKARPLELDPGLAAAGAPTLDQLLRRAAPLAKLLGKSRALRPQDLAAAAASGGAIDAAAMTVAVRDAALDLVPRCIALEARAAAVENVLRASAAAATAQARQVARMRDEFGASSAAATAALSLLGQRHAELDAALEAASHFALPQALRPLGGEELIADPNALETFVQRLGEGLAGRRVALAAARTATQSQGGTDLAAWQARVDDSSRALRAAADGDVLPVWPAFTRTAATTPQVQMTGDVTASVGGWARLRPRLALAAELAGIATGLVAHVTRPPAAVPPPDEPPPTRSEQERPTSAHEGVFVGQADVFARPRLCGAVLDEWSDERPSRRQVTGLALHYDSPQSESPKALLLGVPASDEQTEWDLDSAAELVREAIRWTRVRSLPATRGALTRVVAALFGVVAPVQGTPMRRRLPAGRVRWLVEGSAGLGVVLERVSGVPDQDLVARGLRPRSEA